MFIMQYRIIVSDTNNFEEDNGADESPETVAKYIVDQLVASVTAPIGRCHCVFIFILVSL